MAFVAQRICQQPLAESPHSYFFVCRKDKLETPAVVKFRDWIFKQAAEFPAPE